VVVLGERLGVGRERRLVWLERIKKSTRLRIFADSERRYVIQSLLTARGLRLR
jgi:hypothetical protein